MAKERLKRKCICGADIYWGNISGRCRACNIKQARMFKEPKEKLVSIPEHVKRRFYYYHKTYSYLNDLTCREFYGIIKSKGFVDNDKIIIKENYVQFGNTVVSSNEFN